MRLIFVHGMRQEGKDPVALRGLWEKALGDAWARLGLAAPGYELEMPFYGDELDSLVRAVKAGGNVVARGPAAAATLSPTEDALIRDYADKLGIGDAEVRAELGQEVVARGPANWEWVQALGRVLERRVPGLGGVALNMVTQVDGYLDRPHITAAVDALVAPCFTKGRCVVVAHSLGTIVSYRLLRKAGAAADVPLYLTLGSPLGIRTVTGKLKPPKLARPDGVKRWINGSDQRDYVALYATLDAQTFAPDIENIAGIHNRQEDAHYIGDYLAHEQVARAIHEALTA